MNFYTVRVGDEYQGDLTYREALDTIEATENVLEMAGMEYFPDRDCWQDRTGNTVSIELLDYQGEKIPRWEQRLFDTTRLNAARDT